MTRNEAEALISSARGRLCVRLVREADGSTLTAEPFTGSPHAGRRVSPVAAALVTAIMGVGGSIVAAPPAQARLAGSAYSDSVVKKIGGNAESADSTGSLEGTLLDSIGAVIAGATVTLRNDATGDVRGTASSDAGTFKFQMLKPGSYTLEIYSEGFSRQLVNGLDVSTNQAKQVTVNLLPQTQVVVTVGVTAGPPPQPLRALYKSSELIVVARVRDSRKVEHDGDAVLMKSALTISSTLKGQTRKSTVYVYDWLYGEEAEPRFVIGDDLLVFLKRREEKQTRKTKDDYEVNDSRYGVKKLSAADRAVYVSRIKELREIKQPEVNSPEIVEWLVRCAEEPATRWEGASELARSARALREGDQKDEEDPDAEESDDDDVDEPSVASAGVAAAKEAEDITPANDEEVSETTLISMLTSGQKERLAAALFGTVVVGDEELELIEIEKDLRDPRLLSFLISQLHALETDPPVLVYAIVNDVAELMHNEEITRLAEEYNEKALYVDENDASDDDDDDDDGATENRSAEADAADKVTAAAATANRRILLQNFLLVVEGKLKLVTNRKSGASESGPDSTR
jgi:hypothetical protein